MVGEPFGRYLWILTTVVAPDSALRLRLRARELGHNLDLPGYTAQNAAKRSLDWTRCMVDPAIEFSSLPARPDVTSNVTRGAFRLAIALGWTPLLEVGLPNGRRADVMALSSKGEFTIVEVKSGLDDFRSDLKWPEYRHFCDAFYFAVAPDFPIQHIPPEPGLIVADGFGGAVVREPSRTPLAAARRKSLMIAFARLAASRCGPP